MNGQITQPLARPSIHTNGTSANDLYCLYSDAVYAVEDAIKVIGNSAPNGRDYYPQGPAALDQAVKEQDARIARLNEVLGELRELQAHCAAFVREP